jgi:uncharacterized Zn-binding protein involved in type VI secretion
MAEKGVARFGDTGSHGGTIISGASKIIVNDRPMARVGDIYACPIHGNNPIISGVTTIFGEGMLVAHVGSKTACGAVITSGSLDTVVDDGPSVVAENIPDVSTANITDTLLVAAESCPANVQKFFNEQYMRMVKLAGELNIDSDYLMALSSYESGWLNPHNSALNNLFGLTRAGGSNLQFESLDSCAAFWKKNYGEGVRNSKNMNEFIINMRKMNYNTINKKYDETLMKQYNYILRMKNVCTIPKNA